MKSRYPHGEQTLFWWWCQVSTMFDIGLTIKFLNTKESLLDIAHLVVI